MSLVLMCPSTEMQLNESSTAPERMRRRSSPRTRASVRRKPSIVAILGPIIAAPLASPSRVTGRPSIVSRAARRPWGGCRSSGSRREASRKPAASAVAASIAARTPASTRGIGNWWPITPVEATRTWSVRQPSRAAAPAAVPRALSSPCRPVAALALPALMTIARIVSEGTRARSQCTGAAATRLVVNVPAAEQSRSATSTAMSRPPEGLIPARTPEARNPRGRCSSAESLMRASSSSRGSSGTRG